MNQSYKFRLPWRGRVPGQPVSDSLDYGVLVELLRRGIVVAVQNPTGQPKPIKNRR